MGGIAPPSSISQALQLLNYSEYKSYSALQKRYVSTCFARCAEKYLV